MGTPRRLLKVVGLAVLLTTVGTIFNFQNFSIPLARSADKSTQAGSWSEWQRAKALFDEGKYEEALREFQTHPTESAQYFYNVGTAYLKLGQNGLAVANLAKANSLRAHDPEIQRNLQLAQSALGRLLGAEKLDPSSSSLEVLADRVSLGEIRGALGLLGLLVSALWLRAYLRTRSLRRTLLQPSGMIGLLGFAITVALYAAERLAESHPPACAIERTLIRSGPGDQFAQLGQLESGVKIRILGPSDTVKAGDQTRVWNQIRYSQDGIGWVPTSSLLLF